MTYIVYTKSLLIFLEESRQVLPVNRIYVFGNCCNFKALFELTPSAQSDVCIPTSVYVFTSNWRGNTE